jgi:hypothetical protein
MHNSLIHGEPLWKRVLPCNHDVHVVSAAQAVVEDGQEAVGVGREITANDVSLLVDDVIEEAGVLVREPVVILLPDMGGEQVVQRRDVASPRKLTAYLKR